MSKLPQNLENPLQFVRCTVGLSQVEFAARIGLSRSLVAKLESEQNGYRKISERVRRLVAREFGAILQPPGAAAPAIDFDQQPYTLASFQAHKQRTPEPLPDEYPVEAIGTALAWVAVAARRSGVAASFHESIGKALTRLSNARDLAKALDKEIRRKRHELSPRDYIAATWLLQFFDLPQVSERLPRFIGCGKDGKPLFELNMDDKRTSSTGAAEKVAMPKTPRFVSPQEQSS